MKIFKVDYSHTEYYGYDEVGCWVVGEVGGSVPLERLEVPEWINKQDLRGQMEVLMKEWGYKIVKFVEHDDGNKVYFVEEVRNDESLENPVRVWKCNVCEYYWTWFEKLVVRLKN